MDTLDTFLHFGDANKLYQTSKPQEPPLAEPACKATIRRLQRLDKHVDRYDTPEDPIDRNSPLMRHRRQLRSQLHRRSAGCLACTQEHNRLDRQDNNRAARRYRHRKNAGQTQHAQDIQQYLAEIDRLTGIIHNRDAALHHAASILNYEEIPPCGLTGNDILRECGLGPKEIWD